MREHGSGPPLVLLHGLATTQDIWGPVVDRLARRHRVITLDLPGFGASRPAGEGFALDAVADRIAQALAGRELRAPFDLVGHSLGAAVALTLATRRPVLVRRLVLVAPAGLQRLPPVPPAVLGPGAERLFSLRRRLAPLTDLRWGRRLLLAFAADDGGALSPTQARMMVQASAGAQRIAPALEALVRTDLRDRLAVVTAPLGLLWGDRDRAVAPGLALELMALRPDAELELIPGAGHVPMVEAPEAFVHALERVLARLDKLTTS